MWQILGQVLAVALFAWFVFWISVKYGAAKERAVLQQKDKKEYERMQKIHTANSAMSINERLDWLRKVRSQK